MSVQSSVSSCCWPTNLLFYFYILRTCLYQADVFLSCLLILEICTVPIKDPLSVCGYRNSFNFTSSQKSTCLFCSIKNKKSQFGPIRSHIEIKNQQRRSNAFYICQHTRTDEHIKHKHRYFQIYESKMNEVLG